MALPNFLIVGAAKAGTTSLYHYFRQHPDVYMSPVKEPRYFWHEGRAVGRVPVATRQAYERLFSGATSERALGEASPQYLHSPSGPDRIAADVADAKIIVSLRNPADRAYSSYLGRLRSAQERRSVDEAMRSGTYYFETSRYFLPLTRYLERFGSRIRIVMFDDLVRDARAVMRDLYAFIGVDESFDVDVAVRHNAASVPRSRTLNTILWRSVEFSRRYLPEAIRDTGLAAMVQRPLLRRPDPLPASIRRRLLDEFRDDIMQTSELIGRDLTHWLA